MDKEFILEVKKKREFSQLPDSVVERAISVAGEDIKEVRSLLRKYFGVFLTNKVLKGKGIEILKSHKSSMHREYGPLYELIFGKMGDVGAVVDLGCGANCFSYELMPKGINYVGVEAVGQLVDSANRYFKEGGFESAHVLHRDLFDLEFILKTLKQMPKPRAIFLFQVVDALENLEKDFSKKFLLAIGEESERIVLSLPVRSLSGRTRFQARRKWILDFIGENFETIDSFETNGERFLIIKNKFFWGLFLNKVF
ncbi:hypothetical protein HOA55_00025 [archaeon]|jgi:hypothetical protein|nr:hypothetical protein [archaeon]MBT3577909.1 hypothetical protein [archaeon]MBT6819727.1 hypothetical protein [archaeon]MBT6956011.1 hypothetical protein [archaeon]MBT7025510.1 hypothetical protein [archaeon]